jgi:hypothetical protein
VGGGVGGGGFFCGLGLFAGEAAVEAFLFDFQFLLFESEAFVGGGLADAVVPVLVDDGAAGLAEGAGEFGGSEFEKQDEDHEVGKAEDEDGADGAEDGGEELVVEEVADVAAGHFTGGGGGAIEALATGEERVGEGRAEGRGGELEKAGPGDEQDAEKEEFLGIANLLGEKEEQAAGDKDHGEQVGTQAEKEEEDAAEVGAGGPDQVGFGVLGGLGVEGEVARVEGKEGEEEEDAGAEDGEGNDLLAEAGSGACRFWFGHEKGCV